MQNFLKYAWSKRKKWWIRRDIVAATLGRQVIGTQYRLAGMLAMFTRKLAPAYVNSHQLKKTSNPFIEYEIGRLKLKSAPIETTIRETYSQCNEDIIVEAILRAQFATTDRSMSTVRYLEIGGNHPVQTSSTYLLYRAWGARGHIIEANAGLAERLRSIRPHDQIVQTAVSDRFDKMVSFHVHELDELSSLSRESILDTNVTGLPGKVARVETVPNLHINDFFATYIHEPLDFMSIDIEGLDLPVLQALSPAHRPTVLQVECMSLDLLADLKKTLEPRGYRLAAMTQVNVIFVQD
ncbi:FkbM family methyltransferase [Pusillimonas minor]|uniref:FkbM family methyltransferase n=1 Tax=Pusillimonas minor TaxID=2697024 RepID=A0A842HRG0_9BURK|nr:FkbM family methyltransferase [Pusillimonas minor]MBC2769841.1 FkbM family methyltransferase [Pusillimonas minor]